MYHELHGVISLRDLVKKIPGVTEVWGYKPFPECALPRVLEIKQEGRMSVDKVRPVKV